MGDTDGITWKNSVQLESTLYNGEPQWDGYGGDNNAH